MDLDTVVIARGYRPFKREIGISAFSAHTVAMPNGFVLDYKLFSFFILYLRSFSCPCWVDCTDFYLRHFP